MPNWTEVLKEIQTQQFLGNAAATWPPVRGDDYNYWLGDHSFSWVTLRELMDYPWDSPYTYDVYVTAEQAKELAETGKKPDSWASWMSNGVPVSWESTVRHTCRTWVSEVIPALQNLGEPDDVRLVFGFDS